MLLVAEKKKLVLDGVWVCFGVCDLGLHGVKRCCFGGSRDVAFTTPASQAVLVATRAEKLRCAL